MCSGSAAMLIAQAGDAFLAVTVLWPAHLRQEILVLLLNPHVIGAMANIHILRSVQRVPAPNQTADVMLAVAVRQGMSPLLREYVACKTYLLPAARE